MAEIVHPSYDEIMRKGAAFALPARTQEAGLKPLKATCQILYAASQSVRGSVLKDGVRCVPPKAVFMPVTASERRDLLAGEYPAAVEPTAAEITAFA